MLTVNEEDPVGLPTPPAATRAPTLASPVERISGSFRDRRGFVYRRDGVLYRQLDAAGAEALDALTASGLYRQLTAAGLLIPHQDAPIDFAASPGACRVIQPEPVDFVSYPYEWCFGQIRDAALATLEIQKLAIGAGLSLRDASAYNIQFHRGRPILIDTSSLEAYREGEPWVAYRQFCQHFLAPLALMSRVDVRLGRLLQNHLDGLPLDLASALLPARTWIGIGLGVHIHLHARSQRRHASGAILAAREAKLRRGFSRRAFLGFLESLTAAIERLKAPTADGHWRRYYDELHNYGAGGLDEKAQAVSGMLDTIRPRTVWDLGANLGRFSRLAVARGAFAVAWEADPTCVDLTYAATREERQTRLLPLVLDVTNPSAAVGWAHEERLSLHQRGPADAVLALGLVHHLAITNNVPLDRVIELLASLGRQVVVEFVPKEDSQVERLLATRDDVFPDYDQEAFESAIVPHASIEERVPIPTTKRSLYRLRSRAVAAKREPGGGFRR